MNIAPISEPNTIKPAQAATQNGRPGGHVQVVERVLRPPLADEEGDQRGGRDDEQARAMRVVSFGTAREVDSQGSARPRARSTGTPPRWSTGSVALVHVAGHERDRHHERDHRERQGEQEHRAPPEVLEQDARSRAGRARRSLRRPSARTRSRSPRRGWGPVAARAASAAASRPRGGGRPCRA